MQHFDVIISGAGPAGTACALALKDSGLKIALIDKHDFPRDKVCGDAIGGRVKLVLRKIDPLLENDLEIFESKSLSRGWKLVAPNQKEVEVSFTTSGYVSKRIDFDQFLFDAVKKKNIAASITGVEIKTVNFTSEKVEVKLKNGKELSSDLIVGCDGAHSVVKRASQGNTIDPAFYSGAVRSYYSNISEIKEGIIEIHLAKDFLPGYFWIFPLPGNVCNVGFGMLSKDISKRNIDLKKAFYTIIESSKVLSARFKNAKQEGTLDGFGLPLGGQKRILSGDRFLLCGDAASLIDPLNGEGIGNAMLSGFLAAQTILSAHSMKDYSATFLAIYDDAVNTKLLPELKQKLFLQKLFNRPKLINLMVTVGSKNRWLREYIGRKL